MKNAIQITVSTFGVLAGLAGIEHGVGEILQGSMAPGGLVIQSWPGSDFFAAVSGEPAMTVIPNLLVTGILAMLLSLLFIAWVTVYLPRKYSGWGMVLLSIAMLLAGAGFGPPLLGLILSAAWFLAAPAARVHAPQTGWLAYLRLPRFLAKVWRWSYYAALAAWLSMFPGSSILYYFFGVDNATLLVVLIFAAFGLLLLALLAGLAYDSRGGSPAPVQVRGGRSVPQVAVEK